MSLPKTTAQFILLSYTANKNLTDIAEARSECNLPLYDNNWTTELVQTSLFDAFAMDCMPCGLSENYYKKPASQSLRMLAQFISKEST